MVRPSCFRITLNTCSQPDVGAPNQVLRQLGGKGRSFCQHLEYVLGTIVHYIEDALQKVERYALVEQIAHGVDEYEPRSAPTTRFIQ
jgi:hypothetical protein